MVIMTRVLLVNDVLDEHVALDIECLDRHRRPELCQFRLGSARG